MDTCFCCLLVPAPNFKQLHSKLAGSEENKPIKRVHAPGELVMAWSYDGLE